MAQLQPVLVPFVLALFLSQCLAPDHPVVLMRRAGLPRLAGRDGGGGRWRRRALTGDRVRRRLVRRSGNGADGEPVRRRTEHRLQTSSYEKVQLSRVRPGSSASSPTGRGGRQMAPTVAVVRPCRTITNVFTAAGQHLLVTRGDGPAADGVPAVRPAVGRGRRRAGRGGDRRRRRSGRPAGGRAAWPRSRLRVQQYISRHGRHLGILTGILVGGVAGRALDVPLRRRLRPARAAC